MILSDASTAARVDKSIAEEKPLAIARRAAFRCTVWIDLQAVTLGKKVSQ